VQIITLNDGEVGTLHVGLRGTISSIYLKDLSEKTRRGNRGRVLDGRSAGGSVFGYRTRPDGERIIHEPEAAIVRRIFAEYTAGRSPRQIAKTLNREGVSGPGGRQWNPSAVHGHQSRRSGCAAPTPMIAAHARTR
jgi:DNA invertase Pin-like site-specific DNA recombinase